MWSHSLKFQFFIWVLVLIIFESADWIISLYFAYFTVCVLFNKLLNFDEARPTSSIQLIIFLNFKINMSFTISINAFGLAYEHNFQFLSLWIIINEVGQCNINRILVFWNINFKLLLSLIQKFNKLLDFCILGWNFYLIFFVNKFALFDFCIKRFILLLELIE